MKLGLYISYNNIGYAITNEKMIVETGVANVNISPDEKNEFCRGQSISTNPNRTLKRQTRVCMGRYKQRRKELYQYLKLNNYFNNDEDIIIDKQLWALRAKAVTNVLSKTELASVLIHFAKKRGYKPTGDKFNESSEYLANLEAITNQLHQSGQTIGQYLLDRFNLGLHLKNILFKREDYESEYWAIMNKQIELNSNLNINIANDIYNIIFYQRPLKSQKHRVSNCKYTGYKVAHRTNPIFQEFKILTEIENIVVYDAYGRSIPIDEEKLQGLYSLLMVKKKMTAIQILKFFGYNAKADKVALNYDKGLSGNITYSAIKEVVPDYNPSNEELYSLWHLLYSVPEANKLKVLINKYNFTEEQASKLCEINFSKDGYCNLSEKAIKALLVHLRNKKNLSDSIKLAKLKVKETISTNTNIIPLFKKNYFLNIVLEKSANRTINIINDIISKYDIDECIIEFDNLLLKSNEARKKAIKNKRIRNVENENIKKDLYDNYGISNLTNKDLIKYKLWDEMGGYSPYEPNTRIEVTELFDKKTINPIEIEHIIPLSRLLDDSLNNKTICRRSVNLDKDNYTANEYMQNMSEDLYKDYLNLIENAKIGYKKKNRFLADNKSVESTYIKSLTEIKHRLAKELQSAIERTGIKVRFTHQKITEHLKNSWELTNDDVSDEASDDIRLLALNAVIASYTSLEIINQLNDLNEKYVEARNKFISLRKFDMPFEDYRDNVITNINNIIPKYKIGKRLYSKDKNGHANPRIQLHKETIYGLNKKYLIDKNGKRVETCEAVVKYPLPSITEKDVDFIVDSKIREIVRNRLTQYGNNSAKAWEKLDEVPLLDFNGKVIKSIRLWTGLKKIRPLHYENGKWKDYVIEGNIHHLCVYLDPNSKIQCTEISAMTAIMRANMGIDVIIKDTIKANNLLNNYNGKVKVDEIFLKQMPKINWTYIYHLQKGMIIKYHNIDYRIHSVTAQSITLMKPHYSDISDTTKHVKVSLNKLINDMNINEQEKGLFDEVA